jgi:pimeloyl-ACP methyl ester carboxylesterase
LGSQNLSGVAEHMASVLGALGHTGGVDLVGHSFGGGVALELGAIRPDLVRSLTLVCPVGGAGNGVIPLARMAMGAVMEARQRWVGRAVTDLGSALLRHPPSVVTAGLAARQADLTPRLARVNQHGIRARFIFADADQVVTPGEFATCTYDTVTVEVTAGRHGWLMSDPERFAALVIQGLAAARGPVLVA